MTQSSNTSRIAARRAIEALRAGVPNRDAVSQLGCSQPEIEAKFRSVLADLPRAFEAGEHIRGLLVSGNFGSGKSHLLQYLEHLALKEGFVVSRIVVSKETSLADPSRLFRAAIDEARADDRIGSILDVVGRAVLARKNTDAYARFYSWSDSAQASLTSHFAASLYLYEYGGDEDLRHQIVRFWSGEPISNKVLKDRLKEIGAATNYSIQRIPRDRDLALQRFRFATNLMIASGYKGWILLIDEAELIRHYSFKTRARAYAELARWLGALSDVEEGVFPGLAAVATIIGQYDAEQLRDRGDSEVIPNKLRSTGREDDALLATQAERGMRLIRDRREPLSQLTGEYVASTFAEVQKLYAVATQWQAPPIDLGYSGLASQVMRPLVRRWITEWDIMRIYDTKPDLQVSPLPPMSFEPDPDIETSGDLSE